MNRSIKSLTAPHSMWYHINMNREFLHTSLFDKQWEALGLDDDDLRSFQSELIDASKQAPVIQGTGGVRKVRFSFNNKGKSGGVRVLYLDIEKVSIIALLSVYAKSEKGNIDAEEKRIIHRLVEIIKKGVMKNE